MHYLIKFYVNALPLLVLLKRLNILTTKTQLNWTLESIWLKLVKFPARSSECNFKHRLTITIYTNGQNCYIFKQCFNITNMINIYCVLICLFLELFLYFLFFFHFRNVQQGALSTLHSLKTLQLHVNPWLCDCRLKAFRDYVVNRNLYKPPTTCHEPARLNKKHWNKIETMDFACKPIITIPREFVFSSPGRNATLSCLIEGSPLPTLRWVKNGRIINNMTSPVAFSNQIYIIHQETYHIQKW